MIQRNELDKLSLDMIECEKAGYGCHYGKWKAMQEYEETQKQVPDGWRVCEWCGKWFKPKSKRKQKYCEIYCQKKAQDERDREKKAERMRAWRAKQERGKKDG